MATEVKFTEDEIKQVETIQKSYFDVQTKFGQLSIARLNLREQAEELGRLEEDTKTKFDELRKKEKSIVEGKVIAIDNEAVVVDVGLKSEGRIPISEFTRPGQKPEIKLGENLKVFILLRYLLVRPYLFRHCKW